MPNRRCRKSDQEPDALRHQRSSSGNADSSVKAWLARCEARLVETDPTISPAEAQRLARSMLEFERTGAMDPDAAVAFVLGELGMSQRDLFERRSGITPRH